MVAPSLPLYYIPTIYYITCIVLSCNSLFYSGSLVERRTIFKNCPAPSSTTSISNSVRSHIKDHRGTGTSVDEAHGIHVSLMWEGFAKFIALLKSTTTIPHTYLKRARELREVMSLRYDGRHGELSMQTQLKRCLKFLGDFNCTHLDGGSRTDLSLLANGKVMVNIELKAELGSGGKDAVFQNCLYYVLAHRNDAKEQLDPVLLISIAGCHYFQVFGAVFGPNNDVLYDPLSDATSLLNVAHDPLGIESKFARLLYSIRSTIDRLEEYYTSSRTSCIRAPYYNQKNIVYIQPIHKSERVWEANRSSTKVVVKFTLSYNSTVQEHLHAQGMAPQLICEEVLCDGWKAIVMEYIEGKNLHDCHHTLTEPQKQSIIEKLKEAVQSMQVKDYVHGDLRLPNIMIKDSEVDSDSPTPIIVDFDWAGIQGEAKYPVNLNQVVDWPEGAVSGSDILGSHDMSMVCKLFPNL